MSIFSAQLPKISKSDLLNRSNLVSNLLLLDKSQKINKIGELTNISKLKSKNKLLRLDEDLAHVEDALQNLIIDPEDALTILEKEKFPILDMSLFQRPEIEKLAP